MLFKIIFLAICALCLIEWGHYFVSNVINYKKCIKNDKGSVALVIMLALCSIGLISFIVKDSNRVEKSTPVQILQPAREADPNETIVCSK